MGPTTINYGFSAAALKEELMRSFLGASSGKLERMAKVELKPESQQIHEARGRVSRRS